MESITLNIWQVLTVLCVPSAVTGFCFWMIEKRIERREDAAKKREEERKKYELCQLNMTIANAALAEATAEAVQRIPDAHCNGEMHRALEYARQIKNEQREFLRSQAVNNIDF